MQAGTPTEFLVPESFPGGSRASQFRAVPTKIRRTSSRHSGRLGWDNLAKSYLLKIVVIERAYILNIKKE